MYKVKPVSTCIKMDQLKMEELNNKIGIYY